MPSRSCGHPGSGLYGGFSPYGAAAGPMQAAVVHHFQHRRSQWKRLGLANCGRAEVAARGGRSQLGRGAGAGGGGGCRARLMQPRLCGSPGCASRSRTRSGASPPQPGAVKVRASPGAGIVTRLPVGSVATAACGGLGQRAAWGRALAVGSGGRARR